MLWQWLRPYTDHSDSIGIHLWPTCFMSSSLDCVWIRSKGGVFSVCFDPSSWGFRSQVRVSLFRGYPGGTLLGSQPEKARVHCAISSPVEPEPLQERPVQPTPECFPGLAESLHPPARQARVTLHLNKAQADNGIHGLTGSANTVICVYSDCCRGGGSSLASAEIFQADWIL